MTVHEDLALLVDATARLLTTVDGLSDEEVRGPSGLSDWSRGHLITHLARNADGIRNMLLCARSGEDAFMYPSGALRNADIEAGATRPEALIRLDLRAAADRFAVDARSMTKAQWSTEVPMGPGDLAVKPLAAASTLTWMRLREVEIHHVDLDAAYSFAALPPELLQRLLDHTVGLIGEAGTLHCKIEGTTSGCACAMGTGGPTVTGPDHALVAWLLRRSDGSGLVVTDGYELPEVPSLG